MSSRTGIPLLDTVHERSVAIVVAHQDDEAIGFVTVLQHCQHALMVHVTDGAPDDPTEWKGLSSRSDYAEVRRRELNDALDATVHRGGRISFNVEDTTAARHLVELTDRLYRLFTDHGVSLVCTHAYEGGHPDHDAVAFAVHAALKLASVRRGWRSHIIEAPFYRTEDGGSVWQRFAPDGQNEVLHILNDEEQALKIRMLAAHKSQGNACSHVSLRTERYREAPAYDFRQPPNAGRLSRNYARAGLDADSWCSLTSAALAELSE